MCMASLNLKNNYNTYIQRDKRNKGFLKKQKNIDIYHTPFGKKPEKHKKHIIGVGQISIYLMKKKNY